MSSPVAAPMSAPAAAASVEAPVPLAYSVSFEEFRWGDRYTPGKEKKEYATYYDVIAAVSNYLTTRCGKFPNEITEIGSSRDRYERYSDEIRCRGVDAVKEQLRSMADTLENGYTVSLHVALDGTTEYGHAGLQLIVISKPAAIEQRRARILAKRGRLHRCGDPDCDYDCGMLRCGCIEYCECRYDRDDY